VKDLLALLRWVDNPKNRIAAFRTLQLLPGMGPVNAERCFMHFEASGHSWRTLASFVAPALAADAWPSFCELMSGLAAPEEPWEGQVSRVRDWYEPHLERIYEAAQVRAGDLLQLERIAQQFASRERFLTELALDPPQATSDFAGPPLLDEDFLILSTVHSAKGQEWDSVYVLNMVDGSFPSDMSTGHADQIEEERRLLYVAMTRAHNSLHLIAPLRHYIAQQARRSDAHVYGARSRFIGRTVLPYLEQNTWPTASSAAEEQAADSQHVDIAARLRSLWA